MIRFGLAALLISAAAAVVACSASSSEDTATGEGMDTSAPPTLSVVKGREYARCWFDSGSAANVDLKCTTTARGADPLAAKVSITAAGLGATFSSLKKDLDIEAGGTVTVGSMPTASFPVTLMLEVALTADAGKMIGLKEGGDLQNVLSIGKPGDLPANRPALISQPYDLWPVVFLDARGADSSYTVDAKPYTRTAAPYTQFATSTPELSLAPSFSTKDLKGKPRWFVAPAAGGIDLTLTGAGKPAATINGPGYWITTATDFRMTSPAEIAREFAPHPDAGPPPGPVDKDPSCGGDEQQQCTGPEGSSCDDGNRWDRTASQCVACGADGQTSCFKDPQHVSSAMGSFCNDKTRWDPTASKCVACGDAGQTSCYKDADRISSAMGTYCNEGTRWDPLVAKCVTCGDNGEPSCYKDADRVSSAMGTSCNKGTRFDPFTNKCITCGADGQTACYVDADNVSSAMGTKCNDGLKVSLGNCTK